MANLSYETSVSVEAPAEVVFDYVMEWEIRLRPEGNATQVEQHCEFAPPAKSPMVHVVNEDMARQSREEVSANLRRLKSIVEEANLES